MEFNQNGTCFVRPNPDNGFNVFLCQPYRLHSTNETKWQVDRVFMLYQCNLVGIIYTPYKNVVFIYDLNTKKTIGELKFRSDIKQVVLRRERIAVALELKVYVYYFNNLKLLDHIETANNERGLVSMNIDCDSVILACPSLTTGHVRVERYVEQKTLIIPAHQTALSFLQLNANGSMLGTTSVRGTVIRIFDTNKGNMLYEFRRGLQIANIVSMNFQRDNLLFICCSESTIHIYRLGQIPEQSWLQMANRIYHWGKSMMHKLH